MDELPAGDLPSGIGGHGDQGVAAGLTADRSRIGAVYRMARSMPRYRRATFPRAEDACLISWYSRALGELRVFPGGNICRVVGAALAIAALMSGLPIAPAGERADEGAGFVGAVVGADTEVTALMC